MEYKFLKILEAEVTDKQLFERYGNTKPAVTLVFDSGEKYRTRRELSLKNLPNKSSLKDSVESYYEGMFVYAWYYDYGDDEGNLGGINEWDCMTRLTSHLQSLNFDNLCKHYEFPIFEFLKSLGKTVDNDGRIRFKIAGDPLSRCLVVNFANTVIVEEVENDYFILNEDNIDAIYEEFYSVDTSNNLDKVENHSRSRNGITCENTRYGKYDGSSRSYTTVDIAYGEIIRRSDIIDFLIVNRFKMGNSRTKYLLPFE